MTYFAKAMAVSATVLFSAPGAYAQTFDVAGIKIGMTPHQVEKTMHAKGYDKNKVLMNLTEGRLSHKTSQPDFMQHVWLAKGDVIHLREYKGVNGMSFTKHKGRETVYVSFGEYPSGGFAQEVTYKLKGQTVSQADFKARAVGKYGPPNFKKGQSDLSASWTGDQNISIDNIRSKESLRLSRTHLKLTGKAEKGAYQNAINSQLPSHKTQTNF